MDRRLPLLTVVATILGLLLLPAAGYAAQAPAPTLAPPSGQTAIKPFDQVTFGGSIDPDATLTAGVLRFADDSGSHLSGDIDVTVPYASHPLTADSGGALSGSWTLSEQTVPSDATTVRLRVTVRQPDGSSAAGDSAPLAIDRTRPYLAGASFVATDTIRVRFNEPVTHPGTLGDQPSDWLVDGQRSVLSVSGSGDTRDLRLATSRGEDPTAQLTYAPMQGSVSPPYTDTAGWTMDPATDARQTAVTDGIPPAVPTIASVDGQDASTTVAGADATPVVHVTGISAGHEAEVFAEADGVDGLSDGDTPVGHATASDQSGTVAADVDCAVLREGRTVLYARAVDPAGNTSPGADRATYDLDTSPPTAQLATGDGTHVVVEFSEPVTGTDAPAQWTFDDGLQALEVTGSGAQRTISTSDTALGTLRWSPPEVGAYHDAVGNPLGAFQLQIVSGRTLQVRAGAAVTEGTPATFTVRLAQPQSDGVTVHWTTADGTATAGSDYVAASGKVVFAPGDTTHTVTVTTLHDTVTEPDETFTVTLDDPNGGELDPSATSATGTITDDGSAGAGGTGGTTGGGTSGGGTSGGSTGGDGGGTGGGTATDGNGGTAGGGGTDSGTGFRRLAGADRIGTAVAISQAGFSQADTVVVATAAAYPDALAGGVLAASVDGPVLLTGRDRLDPRVADEVSRLGATTAYVLGGGKALAAQVDDDLRGAGVAAVHRIAGTDRFDTARQVALRVGGDAVYVAEGADPDPARGWPDAVAVSGLAARQRRPILLVTHDAVPPATRRALTDLAPGQATIVGGTAAVSDAVAHAIDDQAGTVDRIAGRTRYETLLAVARAAASDGATPARTWFATGAAWPDSLSASVAVARAGAILVLVDPDALDRSPPARQWLVDHQHEVTSITLTGGTAAISETVAGQIRSQAGM